MKTRISAIVGLLCVLGFPLSASAEAEFPTMQSGTFEPYLSFMGGVALPRSADATFQDGSTPAGVSNPLKDIDYSNSHSWGGSAGIWLPTRDKLAGFDLGMEITGYVWYPDVDLRSYFNNDPTGLYQRDGLANRGTTTEVGGIYVGPNFLVRYPMAISESYPNGRWFPYVGVGVGAHQMAMRPGGARGQTLFRSVTDQRDTTIGFQGVGGIKAHLFKYVAAFAEAKYLYAHHNGLSTDRFGNSAGGDIAVAPLSPNALVVNPYSSQVSTILVHVGLSIHFNWEPADWGK
jgi:opacity protein-like surface antigen